MVLNLHFALSLSILILALSTPPVSARASSSGISARFAVQHPLLQHIHRGGANTSSSSPPTEDASTKNIKKKSSRKSNGGANGASKKSKGRAVALAPPLSEETELDSDSHLLTDIETLSTMLSELVDHEDHAMHDIYEKFRMYGLQRASDPALADEALQNMIALAQQLTPRHAVGVTRTFSIMLNLVNSAEVQHRDRIKRNHENNPNMPSGALPNTVESVRGTIDALLQSGVAPADIYEQIVSQQVEIVLTAHPTQVQRKSLLLKYRKISEGLALCERTDLTSYEVSRARQFLRRIVSSIWGADEIRRSKPTPQQEAAGGNAVIESVLWESVPAYLRKLSAQCESQLGMALPIDATPIKFASWIGGDRDGNPNVTPEVTQEVVLQQRLRAARLFTKDLYVLLSELAISVRFSDEMNDLSASITADSQHSREKYRRVIGHLIERLVKTSRDCERDLADVASPANTAARISAVKNVIGVDDDVEPILNSAELLEPLKIMHRSLVETGFSLVADGTLTDIIRRVAVFGMSLVPLDIREESTKHTEALDAITRYLGIGSYKEWDESARQTWLTSELSSRRPLFTDVDLESGAFSPDSVKTIRVFSTAAALEPSALGAYVISQAQTASDVLAVMLLQKQYGMTSSKGNMMRVVPLFETLNDLTNAPAVLATLFQIPLYVGAVGGKQEVMVGYSDSAKDAGRLAACWAQYNSQEFMEQVAMKHGIELTFFHGKGGTVGRGGNPSVYRAIMSHPPNTINGRFRVTEQGEMITQSHGTIQISERTLDIYTSAVCRESFTDHVEPTMAWRKQMERISESSCADYRYLVREEPLFVPYFRQATPELELGILNIGSRPAKRKASGGVESLRAIPWAFAWAQCRSQLSAWAGVGMGLTAKDEAELKTLQTMYKEWPWFRENIDLVSMILSKTDFSISKNYDDQLVDKDVVKLGGEVRNKLVQTRQAILDVTESTDVAGAHVALQRASSMIRHPYIDPVNVIQAELLKRYRALIKKQEGEKLSKDEEETKNTLGDALILSINAIAQGMKNSG